jgi:hypothetical protein
MEHVRWLAQPKLQRPTVIAAFTGWIDDGDAAFDVPEVVRQGGGEVCELVGDRLAGAV